MSCCGQARAAVSNVSAAVAAPAAPASTTYAEPGQGIEFELRGPRPVTVVGPATGTRYVFSEFRRRLVVDALDAAGVARAPELVRVSAP